jgi:hypothetical protein
MDTALYFVFGYNFVLWLMISVQIAATDEWSRAKAIVFGMCTSFTLLYFLLPTDLDSIAFLFFLAPHTVFSTFIFWSVWRSERSCYGDR